MTEDSSHNIDFHALNVWQRIPLREGVKIGI